MLRVALSKPPCKLVRRRGDGLWLAVDEIAHHDEVGGAARAHIGARRVQGGVAARDQDPGDDRGVEYRADEAEPLGAEPGRSRDAGDLDAVRVEILDTSRAACPVDIGEYHSEAL